MSYEEKYLKYRNKYITLKNQYGNGNGSKYNYIKKHHVKSIQ
jgi:hypothetical protein